MRSRCAAWMRFGLTVEGGTESDDMLHLEREMNHDIFNKGLLCRVNSTACEKPHGRAV